LFGFIRVKWLFLRRKISNNVLKPFFGKLRSQTARPIINLLSLIVTFLMFVVTVLVVRLGTKKYTLTETQLQTTKDYQQWFREDRERRADIYLQTTTIDTLETNKVKLSFRLINKGNDIAEKVQVRFCVPNELTPQAKAKAKKNLMLFSSEDTTVTCFKYSLQGQPDILYYSLPPLKSPYYLKLDLQLTLTIPDTSRGKHKYISPFPYFIDYHRGTQPRRPLTFKNPYYPDKQAMDENKIRTE